MKKLLTLILLFSFILHASTDRALKMMKIEQRVALVIGNNNYASDRLSKLKNPINDAKAMKDKLETLGFNVYYGENLSVREMNKKLNLFSSTLKSGGVGLFFFAGHGVESTGKNYLMGRDSNLFDREDIAYESLELNKVIDKMKISGNRLNIILLDACRNDPFSRSGGGGLAKVNKAKGMFIAYATSPGDVASDGDDKHGVFTQEILNHIDAEALPIHNLFKRIKKDVYSKTSHRQRPWTHDDIIGDFFFKLPTGDKQFIPSNNIILNSSIPQTNKRIIPKAIIAKGVFVNNNETLAIAMATNMAINSLTKRVSKVIQTEYSSYLDNDTTINLTTYSKSIISGYEIISEDYNYETGRAVIEIKLNGEIIDIAMQKQLKINK